MDTLFYVLELIIQVRLLKKKKKIKKNKKKKIKKKNSNYLNDILLKFEYCNLGNRFENDLFLILQALGCSIVISFTTSSLEWI